jgi:hypothetical protein
MEQYKNIAYMWFRESSKLGKVKGSKNKNKKATISVQTDPDYDAPELDENDGTYSKPIIGKETGL